MKSRVTLAAFCTLLAGCAPVHADDVVGRYRLNQGDATDVVEVCANGTYIHRYTALMRPAVVDSGRWTLERVNDGPAVVFDGFVPRWRAELLPSAPIEPSIFPAPVERTGSTLKLTVDPRPRVREAGRHGHVALMVVYPMARGPGPNAPAPSRSLFRRNRYYDPGNGRFTQEDPAGLAGESTCTGLPTAIRWGLEILMD